MSNRLAVNCLADGSWIKPAAASLCAGCEKKGLKECTLVNPDFSRRLRVLAIEEHFGPDGVIFTEDTPADKIYIIISGTVRMVKHHHDGRRFISAFMTDGDMIGFVSPDKNDFAAESVTETEVCSFSRAAFQSVIESEADVSRSILGTVSNELIESRIHAHILSHDNAKSRIAAFIQLLLAKEYRKRGVDNHLILPMKRQDIADYLGMALETLSRTINQMARDGLISLHDYSDVRVQDIGALSKLSDDYFHEFYTLVVEPVQP